MRVLAFDTATALTAVALRDFDDDARCLPQFASTSRQSITRRARVLATPQRLLVLIHELLQEVGSSWEEVDRIAVGKGPGTFTGLRIGIATAQALAAATDIPLVGVSTSAVARVCGAGSAHVTATGAGRDRCASR